MVFGALNSIRQTTALIANKDRRSASEEHGLDFCLATLINLSVNHRSPLLLHNINVFFSLFLCFVASNVSVYFCITSYKNGSRDNLDAKNCLMLSLFRIIS